MWRSPIRHMEMCTSRTPSNCPTTCFLGTRPWPSSSIPHESIKKCWCGIHPELNQNGEELAAGECDFLCAGTTTGEICGGFLKMSVFEITAYKGCQYEALDQPIGRGSPPVSGSEDTQIVGQPWEFQEKIDGTNFLSTQSDLPEACDG